MLAPMLYFSVALYRYAIVVIMSLNVINHNTVAIKKKTQLQKKECREYVSADHFIHKVHELCIMPNCLGDQVKCET